MTEQAVSGAPTLGLVTPMSEPSAPAAAKTGAPPARAANDDRAADLGRQFRRLTRNSWWRTNFADNFALEYELDAKIDRLGVLLASLPDAALAGMSGDLRQRLQDQLQQAAQMLADCAPFERVMQRINFVECEIMMRLAEDRLDLALEALKAEVTISLPEAAGTPMLSELDKIAASEEPAARRLVRLVGLKARLGASIIELFRGSERVRDATLILGLSLMALTAFMGGLFWSDDQLAETLFTHFTASAEVPARSPLIDQAFRVLLLAAAFGGIGACLSGLLSFTLQGRVPNEYEGYLRTLFRPIIGMASGVLAVVVLRGGLFTFGDDLAWVALVALVFGFSERLFMGTMARLEGMSERPS